MSYLVRVISILCLLSSTMAFAKQELIWVKWALVPEYIESGEHKGTGYLDKFLEFVQSELPEYHHKSVFQTPNRISRSWNKGNVCTVHLWLGYWPDKIVYSNPYGFTPRFGIVTRKNSALDKQFNHQTSISLKELLEETDYIAGILPLYYGGSNDSRYPLLEPILAPFINTSKVREFRNNRNEMSIAYLTRDRADYIIRQRITHYGELLTNEIRDDYKFYFLDEGRRHKLVASACSNSELGKEVIGKINGFLGKEFYSKYLNLRRQWDANNASFDNTYEDYFLRGERSPFITE